MADEVIASLVGRLSFEVDDAGLVAFGKGLGQAGKKIDAAKKKVGILDRSFGKFSKNLKSGALKTLRAAPGAILAVGVASATAALAITTKLTASFIESGAALDTWAKKAGTTTQELQRLEFAGAQTGAEADNVREAYKTLTEHLGELERVGTGPAVDSLATLGLTLADFKGKDATEQMGLMADAMKDLPNDAERVSVALEVMGEDGAALLPLFQSGSVGIEQMADKADRLGLVLSDKAVKGAVDASGALDQLRAQVTAAGQSLASKLAPRVTELVERLQRWFNANREMIDQRIDQFIEGLVPAIERVIEVGEDLVDVVVSVVDGLGGLENALLAAGVAAGAFTLAAGGIPLIIGAVGVALGFAIADIGGFTDEIERANASIARLKASNRRVAGGTEAIQRLGEGLAAGDLSDISEDEFERLAESAIRGAAPGQSEEVQRLVRIADAARDAGTAKQREDDRFRRQIGSTDVELVLGRRLRARAEELGIGEEGFQRSLGAARASLTEGGTIDAAEDAATDALGRLVRKPKKGRGGKKKVDTSRAERLLGGQIRSLAQGAGATDRATQTALEAAAGSLNRGDAEQVALQAATSSLEGQTGQKLAAAGSPDAQLFGLLTTIGGADAARSATSGARFVRIDQSVNIDVGGIELRIPDDWASIMTGDGVAGGIESMIDVALRERVFAPVVEAQQARGDRP